MPYLDETIDLLDNFEQTCLCDEIGLNEAGRMQSNVAMIRPATRLLYIQTRLMQSIAVQLREIANKPPF